MKLLEKLDGGVKTWHPNPAARHPRSLHPSPHNAQSSLRRKPSRGRLPEPPPLPQKNPAHNRHRHWKEQRLLEITRQLDAIGSRQPATQRSCPSSSSASLHEESSTWEEKQCQVDQLNARINQLRLSGMPPDQLPSPVHIPLDRPRPEGTRSSLSLCSSQEPSPPGVRAVTPMSHVPKHSSSQKLAPSEPCSHHRRSQPSASRSPGLIMTLGNPVDNSVSGSYESGAECLQALKEAEQVIVSLRNSHDDLLMKLTEMESQVSLTESENQDLRTKNDCLESWLAEEQKLKQRVELENQQLQKQVQMQSEAWLRLQAQAQSRYQAEAHARTQAEIKARQSYSGGVHTQEISYQCSGRAITSPVLSKHPSGLTSQVLGRDAELQSSYHPEIYTEPSVLPARKPTDRILPSPALPLRRTSSVSLEGRRQHGFKPPTNMSLLAHPHHDTDYPSHFGRQSFPHHHGLLYDPEHQLSDRNFPNPTSAY